MMLIEVVADGVPIQRTLFSWVYSNERQSHVMLDDKELASGVRWVKDAWTCQYFHEFHDLWSHAIAMGNNYCNPQHIDDIMEFEENGLNLLAERRKLWGDGAVKEFKLPDDLLDELFPDEGE